MKADEDNYDIQYNKAANYIHMLVVQSGSKKCSYVQDPMARSVGALRRANLPYEGVGRLPSAVEPDIVLTANSSSLSNIVPRSHGDDAIPGSLIQTALEPASVLDDRVPVCVARTVRDGSGGVGVTLNTILARKEVTCRHAVGVCLTG